jgi:hypothetical protein
MHVSLMSHSYRAVSFPRDADAFEWLSIRTSSVQAKNRLDGLEQTGRIILAWLSDNSHSRLSRITVITIIFHTRIMSVRQSRQKDHGEEEPLLENQKAWDDDSPSFCPSATSADRPQVEYSYYPEYPRTGTEQHAIGLFRKSKQVSLITLFHVSGSCVRYPNKDRLKRR